MATMNGQIVIETVDRLLESIENEAVSSVDGTGLAVVTIRSKGSLRSFEILSNGVEAFESRLDTGESRMDFEYAFDDQMELLSDLCAVGQKYLETGGVVSVKRTITGRQRRRVLVEIDSARNLFVEE